MLITEVIAKDSPRSPGIYGDLVRCLKMWTFSPSCAIVSTVEANTFSENFSFIVDVPPCSNLRFSTEIQLWQPS